MNITQGTVKEMLALWYKKNTSEFFSDNIQKGNAEFWTLLGTNGDLIGELYIFKNLNDKDFADGTTTAYLCAFRIVKNMQGNGFGTELMNFVFKRLRELGFKYATIGVEPEEKANVRLYTRMGFTEKVKTQVEDPCDVNEKFMPVKCAEYNLLRKTL
jgi:GNAT superfamily N-acetyltransferase